MVKYLIIALFLFSCTAAREARKEFPISKAQKKLNKLTNKHPELLAKDTIKVDTVSGSITGQIDTAKGNADYRKQLEKELAKFQRFADSVQMAHETRLTFFVKQLKDGRTVVYRCNLKQPVTALKTLKTNRGNIYITMKLELINDIVTASFRVDSADLSTPTVINKVNSEKENRAAFKKGFEDGKLLYKGQLKLVTRISLGLGLLLLLLLIGFGLGKHYRLI